MQALVAVIDLFTMLVFVAVITSWLNLSESNPIRRILRVAVDPILEPLRRIVPSMGGLDFSPMLLIFGLQMLKRALLGA